MSKIYKARLFGSTLALSALLSLVPAQAHNGKECCSHKIVETEKGLELNAVETQEGAETATAETTTENDELPGLAATQAWYQRRSTQVAAASTILIAAAGLGAYRVNASNKALAAKALADAATKATEQAAKKAAEQAAIAAQLLATQAAELSQLALVQAAETAQAHRIFTNLNPELSSNIELDGDVRTAIMTTARAIPATAKKMALSFFKAAGSKENCPFCFINSLKKN